MKRYLAILLTAGVGLSQAATAGFFDNDCCDCYGSFELFGEALYLQPSTCSFNYVVVDPTYNERFQEAVNNTAYGLAPVGQEQGVCPSYDWGFRIGGSYVTCDGCKDIRITYSRLSSCDSQCTHVCEGVALWPSRGNSSVLEFPAGEAPHKPVLSTRGDDRASAFQRVKVEWDAVDGEFGSRSTKGCDLTIRSHVGLHWTEIRAKSVACWDGPILGAELSRWGGHSKDTSCAWAIGPRAGVDASYDIACGFGIGAHMGLGLLGGEVRHSNAAEGLFETERSQFEPRSNEFDVGTRHRCAVIPEFDAALGLNYKWCCNDCFSVVGEIGWEFRNYWNAVDTSVFSDKKTANNSTCCHDFALQGLYVHLGVNF